MAIVHRTTERVRAAGYKCRIDNAAHNFAEKFAQHMFAHHHHAS